MKKHKQVHFYTFANVKNEISHLHSDPLLGTLLKAPVFGVPLSLQILTSSVRLDGGRRCRAIFTSLQRWTTQGYSETCHETCHILPRWHSSSDIFLSSSCRVPYIYIYIYIYIYNFFSHTFLIFQKLIFRTLSCNPLHQFIFI